MIVKSQTTRLHPRPIFARKDWIDLCGQWNFAHDDLDCGLSAGWAREGIPGDTEITVPFPPESPASGVGETGFHPVVWYQREIQLSLKEDERAVLHFGAVDYHADVWVNGQLVVRHEGGNTPFKADITDDLDTAGKATIVLRAEDSPTDPYQPRGKQDWQLNPHAIWYQRTTGIWQPVWIEILPALHIDRLHMTPNVSSAQVTADVRFSKKLDGQRIQIRLSHNDESLAEASVVVSGTQARLVLHVPALEHGQARGKFLWSPDSPTLIDVSCQLLDDTGCELDYRDSYVGLRDCGTSDGMFTLNDAPVFVRSVLSQGYWPESHLAAPDAEAIRTEVEWIKKLGFNAVRIHQKVEDPRFLYWCDRLGVMVWGEMANAYAFSPDAVNRFTREWLDVVDRDKSHPCIVTWVPLNESWGVQDISRRPDQKAYGDALYYLTKACDPSRPVIANDGWEHASTDIASIHDYSISGDDLAQRYRTGANRLDMLNGFGPQRRRLGLTQDQIERLPVMITEFGGISFKPQSGEAWSGYGTVETVDDFVQTLAGLFSALHGSDYLGGYCYTQLTDTMQETNGLLDSARQPKMALEELREIIQATSQAVPAEKVDLARKQAVQ